MKTRVLQTSTIAPVVSFSNEPFNYYWFYGGSFMDGEQACILVFTLAVEVQGLITLKSHLHTSDRISHSQTKYINLGKEPKFPLKLSLAGWEITIIGLENDEQSGQRNNLVVSLEG